MGATARPQDFHCLLGHQKSSSDKGELDLWTASQLKKFGLLYSSIAAMLDKANKSQVYKTRCAKSVALHSIAYARTSTIRSFRGHSCQYAENVCE